MEQFVILMLLFFAMILQISAKSIVTSDCSLTATIEQNQNAPPVIDATEHLEQPETVSINFHSGKLLPEKKATYNEFIIYRPNSNNANKKPDYAVPYGLRNKQVEELDNLYKPIIPVAPKFKIAYSMRL